MVLLSLIATAVIVFAVTNTDDLFLLAAFFADPRLHRSHIIAGQFLGIGALVAISLAAALTALLIPPAYVGLLGTAPIVLGILKLREGSDDIDSEGTKLEGGRSKIAGVAAITMANGGDNIGVYVPLFASQLGWKVAVTIAVFAVMTLIWCVVSEWLVNHPELGKPIRRYGHLILPYVLIALGIAILYESGSLALIALG